MEQNFQTSTQLPPPESHNSKWPWIVLVVLVLLIVAGAAGWWLGQRTSTPAPVPTPPTAPLPEGEEETPPASPLGGGVEGVTNVPSVLGGGQVVRIPPAPIPDNWNAYRNDEYGFEIGYPPYWRERETAVPSLFSVDFGEVREDTKDMPTKFIYKRVPISIVSVTNSQMSLRDFETEAIRMGFYLSNAVSLRKKIIDGIEGLEEDSFGFVQGGENYRRTVFLPLPDGRIIQISLRDLGNDLDVGVFKQMLSTFKFIN